MVKLPFHEDWVRAFVNIRLNNPWTLGIAKFITNLGDQLFYIAIISFIYWTISKKKALSIVFAVITSFFFNFVLKAIINNPRPFQGTSEQSKMWAVQETSPSTPSGHAMLSSTFWSMMYYHFRTRWVLITGIILVILIGLSRPFLGVHFFEDILLGWIFGLSTSLLIIKISEPVGNFVSKQSRSVFIGVVLIVPIAFWIIMAFVMNFDDTASTVTMMAGLISGLGVGYDFEVQTVNFDPKAPSITNAILRFVLGLIIVIAAYLGLKEVFSLIADEPTFFGQLLRYIRYFAVGFSAYAIAPYLFVKTGLSPKLETDAQTMSA